MTLSTVKVLVGVDRITLGFSTSDPAGASDYTERSISVIAAKVLLEDLKNAVETNFVLKREAQERQLKTLKKEVEEKERAIAEIEKSLSAIGAN